MDETDGFRYVHQAMHVDVDKLRENVEVTGVVRWVFPVLGFTFFGLAAGLYYDQTQKPSRPYDTQATHIAYSHIMEHNGTGSDLKVLSQSLANARAAFRQSPHGLDYLLQREDIISTTERQYVAAQAMQELESFHWNDNGKGDSLVLILALIGIGCLGAGVSSHYQYKGDQTYLAILGRENTEPEEIEH